MRLLSVNVGRPREIGRVQPDDEMVVSAIYKRPVKGPVVVRRLNLDGDQQANLEAHGGVNQAAYLYPHEHYPYWQQRFPGVDMPFGTFGENLTTEGLLESATRVGDRFAVGTAEFEVTKPRLPCSKLGIRFGTQDMIKKFLDSERTGFYLKVVKEGLVEAGDEIRMTLRAGGSETITSVVRRAKKKE